MIGSSGRRSTVIRRCVSGVDQQIGIPLTPRPSPALGRGVPILESVVLCTTVPCWLRLDRLRQIDNPKSAIGNPLTFP